MSISKDNLLYLLKEKVSESIYPLKMGGNINKESFDALVSLAEEATRVFKEEAMVPKKLLSEIYLSSMGIYCENLHFKSEELSYYSERMMECFNFIIDGKSIDEKKEIGPRIV